MVNFLLLTLLAVTAFGVPVKGSFATLTAATLLYVGAATAMGLLVSTFMRSQVAAMFGTAVLTILPTAQVSVPTTHFVMLAHAVLYRGAGLAVVWPQFLALAAIGAALFGYALVRFRPHHRLNGMRRYGLRERSEVVRVRTGSTSRFGRAAIRTARQWTASAIR